MFFSYGFSLNSENMLPQTDDDVIEIVRNWILKFVIGLNLCPFAKPALNANSIHFAVCRKKTRASFLKELEFELKRIASTDAKVIETTIFIHPNYLQNFLDQNDFLNDCEDLIDQLDLTGIIQIANFHPKFQFANRPENDVTHFVNRSPFPILHLLREDSIEQAVTKHPNIKSIYENNIHTLKKLGLEGMRDAGFLWDKT
jgi:hypothetical protein